VSEPFRHTLRVRYHECDPQGVVFNANYLTYFDVLLTELWRELGGYAEMVEAGQDLVVAEATVRYRAPLRFDDEFDGVVRVATLGETSMIIGFTLDRDGELCAEGENRYVFVGSGGQGKTPIPAALRQGLERYAGTTAAE
jgi:acyl-CoA thioester hydrolase